MELGKTYADFEKPNRLLEEGVGFLGFFQNRAQNLIVAFRGSVRAMVEVGTGPDVVRQCGNAISELELARRGTRASAQKPEQTMKFQGFGYQAGRNLSQISKVQSSKFKS